MAPAWSRVAVFLTPAGPSGRRIVGVHYFIGEKEEDFVLPDGAADAAADLVKIRRRFVASFCGVPLPP